jgi:hypothetical protein
MILTEIPVTELTDTELDAVFGGFLNSLNITPQINVAVPIGVAVGGLGAGSFAAIGQLVSQVGAIG